MRDETSGVMDVTNMRGRAVYVARAKMGGLWFNVGTFANESEAAASLKEYWSTPDVSETKVDMMVVR